MAPQAYVYLKSSPGSYRLKRGWSCREARFAQSQLSFSVTIEAELEGRELQWEGQQASLLAGETPSPLIITLAD